MDQIKEIERPPLVAEEEWRDTGQIGAVYIHTYYPAFIDIPRSSAFITPINRKPVYIHLVRHLKALEVTDFDNSLDEKRIGERLLPVIGKSIIGVRADSVSVNAKDAWGGVGIALAQEPSLSGKIFRNRTFTEIIIGWEIRSPTEQNDRTIFHKALRRLLYTYRYLTPDVRARLGPASKGQVPTTRIGFCTYGHPRALIAIDRLRDNEPLNWRLETLSIKEYVDGLAAHSTQFGNLEQRITNIGSYLMDGFVLPETIAALEAVADETILSGNYRVAIVEATSLAELTIMAAWRRLRHEIRLKQDIDAPDGHTWKFLSEKLLPVILSFYDGDRGSVLRRLKNALQVRHKVVHRGYCPVAEEVDEVLSTARVLMRILEIPNKYRKNWQLKPGMPEPRQVEL